MVTFAIVGPNDVPLYILGDEGATVRERSLSLSLSNFIREKRTRRFTGEREVCTFESVYFTRFVRYCTWKDVGENRYVRDCLGVFIFFRHLIPSVVQVLERCRSVQRDCSLCICHCRWSHFSFTSQEEKLLSVPNLFREGSWDIRQGILFLFPLSLSFPNQNSKIYFLTGNYESVL